MISNQINTGINGMPVIPGDKSISHRSIIIPSISNGVSEINNILKSEDVLHTLNALKSMGVKIEENNGKIIIFGNGLNIKKHGTISLNAGNSGTLGRIILGLLINSKSKIKLLGDKSLSKRDFSRVIKPLKRFGAKFNKKKTLPLTMIGLKNPKPIRYYETRGSAQCKTSIMFAALKSTGTTEIKAKKSRNHTELLFKYLNINLIYIILVLN